MSSNYTNMLVTGKAALAATACIMALSAAAGYAYADDPSTDADQMGVPAEHATLPDGVEVVQSEEVTPEDTVPVNENARGHWIYTTVTKKNPETGKEETIKVKDRYVYDKYTITYTGFRGDNREALTKTTFTYGEEKFDLPKPEKVQAYAFDGWYTSEDFSPESRVDAIDPNDPDQLKDYTLHANYIPDMFGLKFDGNGGDGSLDGMLKCHAGEAVKMPDNPFVKKGYKFVGWSPVKTEKLREGQVVYKAGEEVTDPGKAMTIRTLFAVWEPIKYTIQFNANGGSGTALNQVFEYGEYQPVSECTFKRKGYSFKGWTLNENGTGVEIPEKASIKDFSSEDGAVIMLYAQWTANVYALRFDANGGTGTMEDLPFYYGDAVTLPKSTMQATGYSFKEWNTAADGSGKAVQDAATFRGALDEKRILTLYAAYEPNPYKVEFIDTWDGATIETRDTVYNADVPLDVKVPEHAGYVLAGWNTAADGSGICVSDTSTARNLAESGVAKLYSVYIRPAYTVKFDGNGASGEMEPQECARDTSVALEANGFEMPGKEFLGWCTDKSGSGDYYADGANIRNLTADDETVLYAMWGDEEDAIPSFTVGFNGIALGEFDSKTTYYELDQSAPSEIQVIGLPDGYRSEVEGPAAAADGNGTVAVVKVTGPTLGANYVFRWVDSDASGLPEGALSALSYAWVFPGPYDNTKADEAVEAVKASVAEAEKAESEKAAAAAEKAAKAAEAKENTNTGSDAGNGGESGNENNENSNENNENADAGNSSGQEGDGDGDDGDDNENAGDKEMTQSSVGTATEDGSDDGDEPDQGAGDDAGNTTVKKESADEPGDDGAAGQSETVAKEPAAGTTTVQAEKLTPEEEAAQVAAMTTRKGVQSGNILDTVTVKAMTLNSAGGKITTAEDLADAADEYDGEDEEDEAESGSSTSTGSSASSSDDEEEEIIDGEEEEEELDENEYEGTFGSYGESLSASSIGGSSSLDDDDWDSDTLTDDDADGSSSASVSYDDDEESDFGDDEEESGNTAADEFIEAADEDEDEAEDGEKKGTPMAQTGDIVLALLITTAAAAAAAGTVLVIRRRKKRIQ